MGRPGSGGCFGVTELLAGGAGRRAVAGPFCPYELCSVFQKCHYSPEGMQDVEGAEAEDNRGGGEAEN